MKLSLARGAAAGATASELVQRELQRRIAAVEREREQTRLLGRQQTEQLTRRVADLRAELAQADDELRLRQARVASAAAELQRLQNLKDAKFLSEAAVSKARDDWLEQQAALEALRRQRTALARELRAGESELPAVELRTRNQLEQLDRQASELQQGMVQEDVRREYVLRAPFAGTFTNLVAAPGEALAEGAPIAVVVPGGGLHARLLVPTRAIGFIRPGDAVVLRYEAFPFQHYGQYAGTVERVSREVWVPGDKLGPLAVREPVYRVDVRLSEREIQAGGAALPLRPGMLLSADVLLERRKVWQWLFEPALALRERLR